MPLKLKPLSEQTIVITGASSGIGLATAIAAAKGGAKLVLVARDETALKRTRDEIRGQGGQAEYVVADVGEEEEVQKIVEKAKKAYGGFDTWINDAGVGLMGELVDIPTADHQRLFQTNYWGVVYGSIAAVKHFQTRGTPSALINIGSVASDISSPILGAYAASKHAVKGFTDALRIELLSHKAQVAVTLVKPAAIDTPFAEHAKNLTDEGAKMPDQLYAPEVVAKAILYVAQHPKRDITVGGSGREQVLLAEHAPGLADKLSTLAGGMFLDKSKRPSGDDGFYEPGKRHVLHSGQGSRKFSLYTSAQTHPKLTLSLALGVLAGVGLAAALSRPEGRKFARENAQRAGKWASGLPEAAVAAGALAAATASDLDKRARKTAKSAKVLAGKAGKRGSRAADHTTDIAGDLYDFAVATASGLSARTRDAAKTAQGFAKRAGKRGDQAIDYAGDAADRLHDLAAVATDQARKVSDAALEHAKALADSAPELKLHRRRKQAAKALKKSGKSVKATFKRIKAEIEDRLAA